MKWGSHTIFFSGNRQEVNSTWYPEIEELIKSREKHYSLVLYILNPHNPPKLGAPRLGHPCSEYFPSNEGELCKDMVNEGVQAGS